VPDSAHPRLDVTLRCADMARSAALAWGRSVRVRCAVVERRSAVMGPAPKASLVVGLVGHEAVGGLCDYGGHFTGDFRAGGLSGIGGEGLCMA
jgi:hypothetical protein